MSRDGSSIGLINQPESPGSNIATNIERVNEIKTKVNNGLAKAVGSKNKNVIKKTVKDMKNPIITAIKKTLQLSNNKLTKDYY